MPATGGLVVLLPDADRTLETLSFVRRKPWAETDRGYVATVEPAGE
jgi:hypothetical protein